MLKNRVNNFQLTVSAQATLRELGVAALYLFGSRAEEAAGPLSDFDFAVVLDDPKRIAENSFDLYQRLYDALSPLCLPETPEASVLDIVFLDSPRVPLELKFNIMRHGRLLFDTTTRRRADLAERIMESYCDFRPLLNMFDQAILGRL